MTTDFNKSLSTPINQACQNTKEKNAILSKDNTTFTTKKGTSKHKHKQTMDLPITESMPFTIDDLVTKQALFEGKLTHLSFDCPTNLRTAFNHATKQNGSSVCKMLQQYMAAYVTATMIKKHALANMKIDVEKQTVVNVGINELSFNQNIQNRPRRLLNPAVNSEVVETVEGADYCEIGNGECRNPAKDVMRYKPTKKEYRVCSVHSAKFAGRDVWELVK